jgi:hypothetical protein
LSSSLTTISDVYVINDDIIRIQYKEDVQNIKPTPFSNIAIASFVTSYGRIHLYEQLNVLNERLIYSDTDSCVFKTYSDEDKEYICQKLHCGPGLGQLKSELKSNEYITKIISLGSKVYCYFTNLGNQKFCLTGIPYKMGSKDILTFSTMETMLNKYYSGENDVIKITYPYNIRKNSKSGTIISSPLYKTWKTIIDKRTVDKLSDKTYPFGY